MTGSVIFQKQAYELTLLFSRLSLKCIKIARPTLFSYIVTREEFEGYIKELFRLLISGVLKVKIHGLYSLSDIQQAYIISFSPKTRQILGT